MHRLFIPIWYESIINRTFRDLEELEDLQAERCRSLQAHPEVVQARTAFHWWPGISP
jgi:hypothetical protein